MKKQKNEKIKKIWSKIKKPLMILSIIGNIIFILSLIIGSANVNKNKTVNQVGASYQDIDLNNTTWEIVNDTIYQPNMQSLQYTFNDLSFTSNSSTYTNLILVKSGSYITDIYYGPWGSSNRVYSESDGWSNQAFRTITINTPPTTYLNTFKTFLSMNATQINDEPDEPVEPDDYEPLDNISLGDNFLPSVYISQGGDFILNGFAGRNSSADTHNMLLNGFTFSSNGETFNQIRLIYGSLNATSVYVTEDGNTLLDVSTYGNYMVCVGIKYEYVEDNNVTSSVLVCSPRRTLIDSGGTTYKVFDVRPPFNVWVNDAYRNLEILEDTQSIISDSYLQYSGKSAIQLLQITTNASQQVMGFTNVFAIMSSAFAGLASILGITILPGITIGLLLFIPLIVVIIITVIKLIKK